MQIAASQQPAAIFAIAVIYPVAENSARTDGADEVQFVPAGPCALWHGQPGQVGNEAATAISCKCRRQGSPLSLPQSRNTPCSASCDAPQQFFSFSTSTRCRLPPHVALPPTVKPIVVWPLRLWAKVVPPCIKAIALTIAKPRP